MDLSSSAHEASTDFGDGVLHDGHEHSERKSSHAFRTISEVSEEIDVPQHVLRFWESKFGQIRPLKRGGGRRYYRPEDIELLKRIKNYLYKQGYTIKGVQRLLKEKRQEAVANFVPYANPVASLPGYPFEQALQAVAPLSISSYLQAASTAPSALAMAYGSISGQIVERAGTHQFGDAFEQSTVRIEKEENTARDQMERSLFAVTQIHEEIASPVQPIRIINPAAPSLDDMADDVVGAAAKALELDLQPPRVEGLPMLTLPEIVQPETPQPAMPQPEVMSAAPQVAAEIAIEAFEEDEFNQDVEEELPVKRLDEALVEAAVEEVTVFETAYETAFETPLEAPFEVEAHASAPASDISPQKKQELLGILAEMMALRDMLNVGIIA